MSKKIFIGNLSWNLTENDVQKTFEKFGAIESTKIVTDRDTGRSKGFGFVTFMDAASAQSALSLDGSSLDNRPIKVDIAVDRPRTERQGDFRGGNKQGYGNRDSGFKRRDY